MTLLEELNTLCLRRGLTSTKLSEEQMVELLMKELGVDDELSVGAWPNVNY
jgi:hypothetical protein